MGSITSATPAPTGTAAIIHTDGSCPENPGPMGIGYTIHLDDQHENEHDLEIGYRLGPGTNNRAEYLALIAALRHALLLCCTSVHVYSDSLLVVNHVNGKWKCRDGSLRNLLEEAQGLAAMFPVFTLDHIDREDNTEADRLSKNPTADHGQYGAVDNDGTLSVLPKKSKISRQQAAMIRWWWATKRCRNEYRLGRIFGIANSYGGRIGRGEKYGHVTEADLPGPHFKGHLVPYTTDLSKISMSDFWHCYTCNKAIPNRERNTHDCMSH